MAPAPAPLQIIERWGGSSREELEKLSSFHDRRHAELSMQAALAQYAVSSVASQAIGAEHWPALPGAPCG